jgi:hypothetical protein
VAEVDGRWRTIVEGLMMPALIVEREVIADALTTVAAIDVFVQIDLLIFDAAPKSLGEYVLDPAA